MITITPSKTLSDMGATDEQFLPSGRGILGKRIITSANNPTLFHYCTPATAAAVLQNRTLRFSDITHLNDAEERVWGEKRVFKEVIERVRTGRGVPKDFPNVEASFFSYLEDGWKIATDLSSQFAVCFSTDGDSLSQWRAYAADGEGFALGFNIVGDTTLPFYPLRVEYDHDQQISEMFDAFSKIWHRFGNNPDRADKTLVGAMISLSSRSIAFKNPAFREELEVRLAHTVVINDHTGIPSLASTGVKDENNKQLLKLDIKFESRRNLIVPFIDLPFREPREFLRLTRIHMGPKCKSRKLDVERMLGTLGYGAVEISAAGAAYR